MYDHHIPITTITDRQALFALNELIGITRALAETLKSATLALHAAQDLTVSERSLMLELKKSGPTTVPALAKSRNVSRQFVQATANPLLEAGVLMTKTNPAHRRSKFLMLTPRGVEMIREAMRKEGGLLKVLAQEVDSDEIKRAAQTLANLQEQMNRAIG